MRPDPTPRSRQHARKPILLATLSFALILMMSSFSPSIVSAATAPISLTFSSAVNLSNDSGAAQYVTVSNNGQYVYVAWSEGSGGILFRASSDGGASWVPPLTSPALKLSPHGGKASFPVMFTQFQSANPGDVYVAWAQSAKVPTGSKLLQVFVASSTNNGQSFITTQLSGNLTHRQETPAIAASGGDVYVTWHSAAPGGSVYVSSSNDNGATWSAPHDAFNPSNAGESEIVASGSNAYLIGDGIYFTTSHNGGASWSKVINLYKISRSTAYYGREPWIAAYGNLVYSTWEADSTVAGVGYQDYGRVSTDGGLTWGPNQTLSGAVKNDWEPENAAFGNNVFTTFHALSNQGIYVTSATGVTGESPTWSTPVLLSPTGPKSSYAHIFTSDGVNVFVFWGQQIQSGSAVWNAYVSYSGDSGATWGSPVDISNNPTGVAAGNNDVTQLAVSSNGIHCFAAWTFANADASQIYFASS